jgi:microcystin-dependent protein
MDYMIADIILWGGMRIPLDFLECNGQLVQISQYTALYSIIGITYGGDGKTTFALPDLRCRVPVGHGTSLTGASIALGKTRGSENVTLTNANLAAHTHPATFSSTGTNVSIPAVGGVNGNTNIPSATVNLATGTTDGGEAAKIYSNAATTTNLKPIPVNVVGTVTVTANATGTPTPVSVVTPQLGLTYLICCNGIYPNFD